MEWKFIQANMVNFLINIVYALVALFIGALAFRLIDRFIFRDIDFVEESQLPLLNQRFRRGL